MNGRFQDEWLSAFLDGEAGREERAEVERRLNESPELRQELEDFQELSNLLRGLPRHRAPEELRGAVLQAAERATLLPTARPPKGSWKFVAASLATSVVALLAFVIVWQRNTPEETPQSISIAEKTSFSDRAEVANADRDLDHSAASAQEATVQPTAEADFAATPEPVGSESTDAAGGMVTSRGNSRLVFDADDLNGARVGDVIQAIDNSGEELTIVKLTVVDRQDGLEALQFLLSKNQIRNEPSGETEKMPAGAGDQIVAVYVESSRTQLAVALEEFMREQQFQALKVEGPVRLASLDPDSQARIGLNARSKSNDDRQIPSPSADRAARSRQEAAPEAAQKSAPRVVARADSQAGAAPQKSATSRQKQLVLPAELLEMELLKIAGAPRGRSVASPTADRVASRPTALHVLFVIVGPEGGGPSEMPPEAPDRTKRPRPVPFRDGAA